MDTPIITRELLDAFGIKLDDQDETTFLQHLNDTLEDRVGVEITDSLDDAQLAQLVDLQENGTDDELTAWFDVNVPEMQQIAQDEIDILLGEVAKNSDNLNATTA